MGLFWTNRRKLKFSYFLLLNLEFYFLFIQKSQNMHSSGKTAIFFRIFFKKVRKYGQKSAFFWLKIFKKCHFYRFWRVGFFAKKTTLPFRCIFRPHARRNMEGFWTLFGRFWSIFRPKNEAILVIFPYFYFEFSNF